MLTNWYNILPFHLSSRVYQASPRKWVKSLPFKGEKPKNYFLGNTFDLSNLDGWVGKI
jgi:hypothetical protein